MLKTYFGNPQPGQETTEVTMMILIPWIAYLIGEVINHDGDYLKISSIGF